MKVRGMARPDSDSAVRLEKLRKIDAGEIEAPPARSHPERVDLYGGVAGLHSAVPEFRLAEGLVVRDTFAHVMAPYIMAFAKPKTPRAPHPGPWVAASGGLGFDITIEISLTKAARPTNFDRLNTL